MSVEHPPIPSEERKPAWRRACLAYREIRQAGGSDQQAHEAIVEAVQQVLPVLSRKEASDEAVNEELFTISLLVIVAGSEHDDDDEPVPTLTGTPAGPARIPRTCSAGPVGGLT
jgi:hypothetical protein